LALCDYFLQLTPQTGGPIEGESADAQFPKQIELETWNWAATNATTIGSATGGAGAGKVTFKDFHFTAKVNKASVAIMFACCSGAHFKTAVLTCRKAGGTPQVYMKITMSTVFVTQYEQLGNHETDATSMDDVTLACGKIEIAYGVQDAKGIVNSLDQKAGWDRMMNKKV
jgi:type VI secretion system secreted protein Hcp